MQHVRNTTRWILTFCGWLCVVLAALGIVLPGLPTTPFLLLAAVCFSRSDPRFYAWLIHHRWFGPYIRNYRERRGMSTGQIVFTLVPLWLALGSTAWWLTQQWWLRLLLVGIGSAVTVHILRVGRRRPQSEVAPTV